MTDSVSFAQAFLLSKSPIRNRVICRDGIYGVYSRPQISVRRTYIFEFRKIQ